MTRPRFSPALLALAALCVRGSAQAPDGFRTHADAESGVTFFYPTEFQEIPLPPTEVSAKAKYVRKQPPDCLRGTAAAAFKPTFEIFLVDREKGGVTPKTPESRPESRPESGPTGPQSWKEAMLAENRIEGFAQFKERRLRGWSIKPIGLPTLAVKEYALEPEKGPPANTKAPYAVGFVSVREDAGKLLILLGVTQSTLEREAQTEFRKIAKSLRLADAASSDDAAARAYAGKDYRQIPFRIGVRRALAKGWRAIDTENFVIVYHTDNEKLVNKIARDLEAVRPLYVKLFPPVKPVEAVAIVRVCKDQAEYMSYGAPQGSGGFFHPGNEELVFFDYLQTELEKEKAKGRKFSDKDSLLVLYHEAFHQYIHYAVGEIAPHDWFNEGHGDYFSGALIPQYGTQVASIGPSRWRISRIKDMAEGKKPGWVALDKLVHAPRQEYYAQPTIGNYYAMGWAFVYFMRESPEVKKNPKWARIVDDYFDVLKIEYAKSVAALGPAAPLQKKEAAAAAARDLAIRTAFQDVDFPALEHAFRDFIIKLKHPWPEDRENQK